MRPAPLVLLVLLTGCVTRPPADDGTGDVPLDAPTRLVYGGLCDEMLGAFPVAPDAVALPEGFAPAPFVAPGPASNVFVIGWRCAAATTDLDANASDPVTEVFAGYGVVVPEEYRLEGAYGHAILLGLGTSSNLSATTYEAWGIPAALTDVAFEWQAAPRGGSGRLAAAAGPLDIDIRVNAGPDSPDVANAARFFVVEGDRVTAAYDIAWTDAPGVQGQALSSGALPGAPPATTGLGFYYSTEVEERYVMSPVELPSR
ncbi:MAG TPA: hypothetical protein VM370_11990 [Candidatus Thermoplasmatota archaeon]|nr:hypothetical protein [Candidatus Thermoplasmatota archaeon]